MNDKLKRRLKKLLALAERGVDGEKETAQRMLDKTLEKHGLTLDDLEGEEMSTVWFRYQVGPHRKELLIQLLAKIIGKDVYLLRSSSKQRQVGVICTEYQRVQIELSHKIYERAFAREVQLAYTAFISCNELYATDYTDEELTAHYGEQTPQQEQDSRDANRRAMQMDPTSVLQGIENKS